MLLYAFQLQQTVQMARYVWEVGQVWQRGEWKSAMTRLGAPFVTQGGTTVMLRWHADNWDSFHLVSCHIYLHINIRVWVCMCMNKFIPTCTYIHHIPVHRGDLTWKLPLQGHGHIIMLILDMARVIYILTGLVALEENKRWSTALTVELESPHTIVAMMMTLVSGVSVSSSTRSDIMNDCWQIFC